MAVLVGPEQLALVEGEDALGGVGAVPLFLRDRDDNASAEARLTLDPLHLEAAREA